MIERRERMDRENDLVAEVIRILLAKLPSGGTFDVRNFGSGSKLSFTMHGTADALVGDVHYVEGSNVFGINGLVFPGPLRSHGLLLAILRRLKARCEELGCGLVVLDTVDRLRASLVRRGGTLLADDDVDVMTMNDFTKEGRR